MLLLNEQCTLLFSTNQGDWRGGECSFLATVVTLKVFLVCFNWKSALFVLLSAYSCLKWLLRKQAGEVFYKKSDILRSSRENTWARASFFNKIAGLKPATLLKKDSGTGVFQWILLWKVSTQCSYKKVYIVNIS